MYGTYKAVKPLRGKVHDYLGMKIDFGTKDTVIIDMDQYVHDMIVDFPVNITKKSSTPAGDKLMEVGFGKLLDKQKTEAFHTTVAKGFFVQESTSRYPANNRIFKHQGFIANRNRLEEVDTIIGVFEWYQRFKATSTSRQPEGDQVVCRCVLCSTSRFQESHRSGYDDGTRRSASDVKEEAEYAKKH